MNLVPMKIFIADVKTLTDDSNKAFKRINRSKTTTYELLVRLDKYIKK